MTRRFDAIVIGAGQAGPSMAARLAASGKTAAVIERKRLGGTCVNVGCTPTKTLVASAYARIWRAAPPTTGSAPGRSASISPPSWPARPRSSTTSRAGLESWLKGLRNLTVIDGHARFVSPHAVEVGGERLEADQVFINVGARAAVPEFPGVDQVRFLTNTTLLELDALPGIW